jgi:ubiquinone/menaquinone biosynthesis C-methylase UbiE
MESAMNNLESDKVFAGSIPRLYEEYLVPLIFEPYAGGFAKRLISRKLNRVLEVAAGTGVVTRHLASLLPNDISIVATDLSRPMLDLASEVGTSHFVEWRQADAMQLPFEDESFDAVVCQFGVMFFPDKSKAFAEARRVLKAGGVLLFSVWDRIEENEFVDAVTTALESIFPTIPCVS